MAGHPVGVSLAHAARSQLIIGRVADHHAHPLPDERRRFPQIPLKNGNAVLGMVEGHIAPGQLGRLLLISMPMTAPGSAIEQDGENAGAGSQIHHGILRAGTAKEASRTASVPKGNTRSFCKKSQAGKLQILNAFHLSSLSRRESPVAMFPILSQNPRRENRQRKEHRKNGALLFFG